jgi:hypothetical protein
MWTRQELIGRCQNAQRVLRAHGHPSFTSLAHALEHARQYIDGSIYGARVWEGFTPMQLLEYKVELEILLTQFYFEVYFDICAKWRPGDIARANKTAKAALFS